MRATIAETKTIVGKFTTGDAVAITIYNLSDSSIVILTSSVCAEIGSTGIFKWNTDNITTQPTSFVEYLWIMGNGATTIDGIIVLGGYPDQIKEQTDKMFFIGGEVVIDIINGIPGTALPIGTRAMPSNNLTDALIICSDNNIKRLRLRSDLTIENIHDVSGMSIETRGIMGIDVTLSVGCNTNYTTFRYLNLQGIVNNSDVLLVENCSIGNLTNFTGIMQDITFIQGSECSIGSWAELYNCRAGGESSNEPEINIGNGVLNVQQYRGNIKLINKTGDNRTTISCLPANVIIDSTCIAGKIQILGIGEIEADNSGAGCQVDIDAAITNKYIADAVWDEILSEHTTNDSFGLIFSDMIKLLGFKITRSGDIITIYESDGNTIWRTYNVANSGRIQT